jgi:hypothetical protein
MIATIFRRKVVMLIEMRNTPIGGCLQALCAQTARPDCTLWIYSIPIAELNNRIAANDFVFDIDDVENVRAA